MSGIIMLIDNKGRTLNQYQSKYLGNILSICLDDKWLYALDGENNITTFNIEHGIMVNYIKIEKNAFCCFQLMYLLKYFLKFLANSAIFSIR